MQTNKHPQTCGNDNIAQTHADSDAGYADNLTSVPVWTSSTPYLHEVLLRLIHARHIIKRDASVGLHLNSLLSLAFGKVEGIVARASHALRAARQQEQPSHQQQRECKVACQPPKSSGLAKPQACNLYTSPRVGKEPEACQVKVLQ